ncbi:MAG TPA: hypothetical protein VGE22_01245 [Solimonas sp.]
MKPTKAKLLDHLEIEGWDVLHVQDGELDWWADEIWELISRWSPQGVRAFLTFLVDPQWEGPRPKGSAVWAIGLCGRHPEDRHEARSAGQIYARPSKANMEELIEALDRIRWP